MKAFHLEDEWSSQEKERSLVASVAVQPALYYEFAGLPDDFWTDPEAVEEWNRIAEILEADELPENVDWEPAEDPWALVEELLDLRRRRVLAGFVGGVVKALHGNRTVDDLLSMLQKEVAQAEESIRNEQPGGMVWASDLIDSVLLEAEARRRQYQETGRAAMGLLTGIKGLDGYLNGLAQGVYILAGPPGVGKTTFALQVAGMVAEEAPVVLVTFENSPKNLVLKAISSHAGLKIQDVNRGFVEMEDLREAAHEWQPVAHRLALIEGTSHLSISHVRNQARRAIKALTADRCLVVVDYLQLWAKAAVEYRQLGTVRERVEALGVDLAGLASQLHSPVLAISSLNREHGNYGRSKGTPGLDSLKESGDLEYAADSVLFLTPAAADETFTAAKRIKLIVAKNRHGETGKVNLIFRPDRGLLREEANSAVPYPLND